MKSSQPWYITSINSSSHHLHTRQGYFYWRFYPLLLCCLIKTLSRLVPFRRLFPLIQDAEHNIYILQKCTRRQAVCMSNGECAAEGILDLNEELEM